MSMTLGTYLRAINGRVAEADSQLLRFYGETFVEPEDDKGVSQLQRLDTTLAQLEVAASEMRGRIASLLEDRRGT